MSQCRASRTSGAATRVYCALEEGHLGGHEMAELIRTMLKKNLKWSQWRKPRARTRGSVP